MGQAKKHQSEAQQGLIRNILTNFGFVRHDDMLVAEGFTACVMARPLRAWGMKLVVKHRGGTKFKSPAAETKLEPRMSHQDAASFRRGLSLVTCSGGTDQFDDLQ